MRINNEEIQAGEIVLESLKYFDTLKDKEALDLGCGTGENAVFLALRGFNVLGVDLSKQFVYKSENLSKIYGAEQKVHFKEADMVELEYGNSYDLIVSDFVFHYLEEEEIKKVIKDMKEHTNIGGINAITALNESNPTEFIHNFKNEELKNHYLDWEILFYKDDIGYSAIVARKR